MNECCGCVGIILCVGFPMDMTVDDDDGGLTVDKDECPPIPVVAGYGEVANVVTNLVHS